MPFFQWLDQQLFDLAAALGLSTFDVNPVIAVVLVGLTCGLVGSLVVGNQMAFFSDAMAHTAFAGIAFALVGIILLAGVRSPAEAAKYLWVIPFVMSAVGILTGVGIAYVREQTGLTNDTVIGVFFALAVGIGAMILPSIRGQVQTDPDVFLFGSITLVNGADLFTLLVLLLITVGIIGARFNALMFASFGPSLARSRGLNVRLNNYLFIVLLALVVNLSIRAVGALLINALLVVPAAAAANVGRNLRQVFWLTLGGTVALGLLGQQLAQHVAIPLGGREPLRFGPSGTIVVLCTAWFFLTMLVKLARRRPAAAGEPGR